jgi:type IV pilus assembly protein PilE
VSKPATRPLRMPPDLRVRGFTLIEVMIVVAIVAILAAIAVPAYSDYVRRGKIVEATTALSDFRTRMEQYFLDNRTYVGGCAAVQPAVGTPKAFTLACPDPGTLTTYSLTATGIAAQGMNGFVYGINQANAKVTTGVAPGWGNNACGWVTRKDGSCS